MWLESVAELKPLKTKPDHHFLDEKPETISRQIQLPNQTRQSDYIIRWNYHRLNPSRRLQMIDRVAVAGMVGTGATFGLGTVNELVGIIAGLVTITFMVIKIIQEFRK